MSSAVSEFQKAKRRLMQSFSCNYEYPIQVCPKSKWLIDDSDGMFLLSYWDETDQQHDYYIVKKDGKPEIFQTKDFTMIVAIDCVKYGFVFQNSNKM